MDKLSWFKFIISDWMMGKIMKCPEVTQARFIRLCCLYWNKECTLSVEDAEIEIDAEHLDILSGKKIVIKKGDTITIKFLDEQKKDVSEVSQARREAVQKRWDKVKEDTIVPKVDTIVIQSDTEKRREEKIVVGVIPTSPTIFSLDRFEKEIHIGTNDFTHYVTKRTSRSPERLEKLMPEFIVHCKGISQLSWNNITDAKNHFIGWVNKQKEQIESANPYIAAN